MALQPLVLCSTHALSDLHVPELLSLLWTDYYIIMSGENLVCSVRRLLEARSVEKKVRRQVDISNQGGLVNCFSEVLLG